MSLFFVQYWILQLMYLWWNHFLNKNSLFDNLFRRGWWYFIVIGNNIRMHLFWWEMFFNNSLDITSAWCINQFLLLNIFLFFSFFFFRLFITHRLDSSLFWPLNLLTTILFLSFWLFLVLFWMLWMLVMVNKLMHMTYHRPHASRITT